MEDTAPSTTTPLTPAEAEELDRKLAQHAEVERVLVAQALAGVSGSMRHLMLFRGQRHVERKIKATRIRNRYFSYRHTRMRREDLLARIDSMRLQWSASRTELDPDGSAFLAALSDRLEHLLHQEQRAADRAAPGRPPPDVGTAHDLAVVALIAAPRPGPSAGVHAAVA